MLNDEDINKLKSVFATKDDFKNLATKDDLKESEKRVLGKTETLISESETRMLGKIGESEIKILGKTETLISESEDRIMSLVATKAEMKDLKEDLAYLRELVQGIIVSNDAIAKSITDMTLEYAAVKMQLSRHDNWIKQIAEKIGIQLVVD